MPQVVKMCAGQVGCSAGCAPGSVDVMGTQRRPAIADIDFERASARDLTNLIDCTLEYLSSRQP